MNDTCTIKALKDLVKTVKKSADVQDVMFIGYPSMREKIREAGFPVDDYRYVELNSTFSSELDKEQVFILPVKSYSSDVKFYFDKR